MPAGSISRVFYIFSDRNVINIDEKKYIETKRFQKEQKYLWKDVEALETFDYKGKVKIGDHIFRACVKNGRQVRQNQKMMVVGIDGFTLVVE